ncbi:transcription elongation factor spt5, partial [Spiromyces aspiralis]
MSDSEARHRDEELDNQKYHHDEVDGEEEEEDLGFDDEEQDNEEEEYYNRKHKKGRKKRRLGANMFIDVEAAVDTEEEEEEEEEADLDFIQDDAEEVAAAEAAATVQHRQSFRQREMEEISAEELAQQIKDRYADYGYRREAPEYAGSSSWTPRVLLVPSVNDPHLWMIKCRPGKERDVVFMIMRKYFERKNTSKPMEICSAYCRDGLSGYVYLEARNQAQAQSALDKVSGLLGSKLQLVPVDQMQDVVTVKKKLPQLQNGAWVRVRRGKYAGDLARVISVSDTMDTVEVRLVPRLDLEKVDDYEKKRKKPFANSDPATRPPQRLFNPREAEKVDRSKPVLVRGHYFVWGADTFRDGYLEKEMKLTSLITQD